MSNPNPEWSEKDDESDSEELADELGLAEDEDSLYEDEEENDEDDFEDDDD